MRHYSTSSVGTMFKYLNILLLVSYSVMLIEGFDADEILRNTIEQHHYPVELHQVETSDGYRLTMARIPAPGRPILFVMHAFLSSSGDYTVLGPEKSLAFLAYDNGFDVWLANGRGNTFSRAHRSMEPSRTEFWNFSFHEVGVFDLPAMIDYSLNATGRKKVHYVGHSQGATNFLVMASMVPEYNEKIASAHLSAPVAFWSRTKIPASILRDQILPVVLLWEQFGYREVAGRTNGHLKNYLHSAIEDGHVTTELLMMGMWMIVGEDEAGFNQSSLDTILETFPAGGSVRQIIHFSQTYQSGRFHLFDFGEQENLRRYGRGNPPDYPLDRVVAPVALYTGLNDPFVATEDLEQLSAALPNLVLKYVHPDPKWNHINFVYGIKGYEVHQKIFELAKQYAA